MHCISFPISASQDKCKGYLVWGIWTHKWYKWNPYCLASLWASAEAFSAHWFSGCWQLLPELHYNIKYFNNYLTTVADTLHQIFYRTFKTTKDLLDLNLRIISRAKFLLISPLISLSLWGIQNICHKLHDSPAEVKWLLHWLFICHWKRVRARGQSFGYEVKLIYLVANMKQDTLGNCFASQQFLDGSMTRLYIAQQLQSWGLNAVSQTCLMSSYI